MNVTKVLYDKLISLHITLTISCFYTSNYMLNCVKIVLSDLTNFLYKGEPIISFFVILIRFSNYNRKGRDQMYRRSSK